MLESERRSQVRILDEMELERLKKARDAGVVIAVPAALDYCLDHGLPPPSWLVQAASDLLCDLLTREKSTKRGRSAGAVARYRQDMVDFLRWNEVEVLLENQQRSTELLTSYPTTPSPDQTDIYAEEVAKAAWLGTSRSRIYQCVSEVLEKTDAFGGPESIKRSHRQVQCADRSPAQSSRYYLLPYPFLAKLGIDGDLGYGRYAKIRPWRTSPRRARKTSASKTSARKRP